MDGGFSARQIAKWAALGSLFLVPLAPLLVANSYFFPFITGKAFFFRVLIEIAVASWAVLALIDKDYRPRFSWIGGIAALFVLWMFIADAFAINAAKAFWSNFERMEGWVLLIHLLGFFFAAGAVLRVERKWRAWFLTSLAVSLAVSAYALLQLAGVFAIHQGSTRIDATFGNSAYLAIYFLFNVFIATWLALTEEKQWLRWSLLTLAALEGILILFTETRGTVLGLAIALAAAAFLTAVTGGKRVRQWAALGLAALILIVGGLYVGRNSSFVQGNHVLQRITSISLSDGVTRFTIWKLALEGAKERPVFGWGQEGFNYVFNKYYDPSLHAQEPWFDRAHNAFMDWLTAGGVPAFLLYLALFGSAFYFLWKRSELSRPERIALTSALLGYAVHNLFVFDNLYSYVYFFAILALVDSQIGRPVERFERAEELASGPAMTYALPISVVVLIGVIWYVNITGMEAASGLITALSSQPADALAAFEGLAAHPAFAAQEVREQIVSFAGNVAQNPSLPADLKQQAVTLAVTEMGKQVASYPDDARERLQLSYAYRAGGDVKDALAQIQAAIALSPKNENFWVEAGATSWDAGNVAQAQKDFNTAYQLGPQFGDLADYAAAGDIAVGDLADADALLQKVHGTTVVDSDILAIAYYRTKNWQRLIDLWKLRTTEPSATAQTWFSLAAAYYTAGEKGAALATIRQAIQLFPDAAASGAAAIQQIQGGAPVQ